MSASQSPPNFPNCSFAFRIAVNASPSWLLVVIFSSLMSKVRLSDSGAVIC
jgi:hypothetical protein